MKGIHEYGGKKRKYGECDKEELRAVRQRRELEEQSDLEEQEGDEENEVDDENVEQEKK